MIHSRRIKTLAFTLVELLVVIAIITVLLAILLPSLGRARANAQATACLAAQKGISLAMRVYCDDRNMGRLFTAGKLSGTNVWPKWLVDGGYALNMKAYRCPSYRVFPSTVFSDTQYESTVTQDALQVSFAFRYYSDALKPDCIWTPKGDPGNCPLGTDSIQINYNNGVYPQFYRIGAHVGSIHLRHLDKTNVFFADSHAQAMSWKDLQIYNSSGPYKQDHNMFYKWVRAENYSVITDY